MIRLISTDFDGTIHDPSSEPPIPIQLVERIRAARNDGARWVINTGRGLEDVVETVRSLGLDLLPDYIVSVERHIHERTHDDWREHAPWNEACQADHHALFAEASDSLNLLREWVSSRFMVQVYEDPWSPLCIIATRASDADQIHERFEKECLRVGSLTMVRNSVYFRFGHARYSKGTALTEIARLLEVEHGEVFAAGDHYNDLSMLDGTHAGQVAAPSNAIPEVKAAVRAAGGYVSPHPCGFGVADAMDFFARPSASVARTAP